MRIFRSAGLGFNVAYKVSLLVTRPKTILIFAFICSSLCFAGDVLYTTWEDDDSQLWVRIQNESDRTIRIEIISLVFYDQKGRPVEERQQKCQENCRLVPRDSMDYGPYTRPSGSNSSRVRHVKYSSE